jgi:hypothetical protein
MFKAPSFGAGAVPIWCASALRRACCRSARFRLNPVKTMLIGYSAGSGIVIAEWFTNITNIHFSNTLRLTGDDDECK